MFRAWISSPGRGITAWSRDGGPSSTRPSQMSST